MSWLSSVTSRGSSLCIPRMPTLTPASLQREQAEEERARLQRVAARRKEQDDAEKARKAALAKEKLERERAMNKPSLLAKVRSSEPCVWLACGCLVRTRSNIERRLQRNRHHPRAARQSLPPPQRRRHPAHPPHLRQRPAPKHPSLRARRDVNCGKTGNSAWRRPTSRARRADGKK